MKITRMARRWSAIGAFAAVWIATLGSLQSQTAGNNTVWTSSSAYGPSTAFIDASAFASSEGGSGGGDLCAILHYIYSTVIPSTSPGAVIDARGITTPTTCTVNPWPLNGSGQPSAEPPTTVLLPAGNIGIPSEWLVASGTHLIGQRRDTNLNPSGFSSGFMLQMGPSGSSCSCPVSGCPPVVLEQITIQGSDTIDVSGVDNECSGPGSYVDHLILYETAGTGLKIGSGAAGSGPYTNINYASGAYCQSNSPCPASCVQISAPTRGVHGITCTLKSQGVTGLDNAGILIDAPNTTIEDIHLEGFVDGVLIGDSASASGSSLLHITGGNGGSTSGPLENTVRICNPATGKNKDLCQASVPATSDIFISQVGNNTGSPSSPAYLIADDLTGTLVGNAPGSSTEYVTGVYALGESVSGGYSRLSTTPATAPSPGTPSWGAANNSSPSVPCVAGAVFSNTGGTSKSNTIYVCEYNGTSNVWNAVN